MREWLTKAMAAVCCMIGTATAQAQDSVSDTPDSSIKTQNVDSGNTQNNIDSTDIERIVNEKYIRRVERYKRRWASLIPNKYTLQYAGDIGMISAGIGWGYGKRQQWETHVMMGYLPKNHTPDAYWSLTLKEVYTPWSIRINRTLSVEPLYCTLFLNSILNGDFWVKEPDRYPQGYYWFSSKIRIHLGFGQKITVNIPTERRFLANKLTLFYGISTCDLYVRQKILNSSIPFKDIICLAVGAQITIM